MCILIISKGAPTNHSPSLWRTWAVSKTEICIDAYIWVHCWHPHSRRNVLKHDGRHRTWWWFYATRFLLSRAPCTIAKQIAEGERKSENAYSLTERKPYIRSDAYTQTHKHTRKHKLRPCMHVSVRLWSAGGGLSVGMICTYSGVLFKRFTRFYNDVVVFVVVVRRSFCVDIICTIP